MTLAELKQYLQKENERFEFNAEYEKIDPTLKQFIDDCQSISIPFWRWDLSTEEHIKLQKLTYRNCCINCKLGWCVKNGQEYPLFDYQKSWYDYITSSSQQVRDIERKYPERKGRVLINKATGVGATEFFLRYIAWCSIVDKSWKNSRVCIVTGPRLDLSVTLIQRIKNLFQLSSTIQSQYGSNPKIGSRETVVFIGSTKIEAFPSNNQQSLRGLTNVKLLLIDEFAHFLRKDMQLETRTIMDRMRTKERTLIVAISTPGLYMDDVMYEMLHDPSVPFHKIEMDYKVALNAGLYTKQEIEIARKSASFDREFSLKWGSGALGSFLHPQTITDILNNSRDYDPDDPKIWDNNLVRTNNVPTYAGLDVAWGSTSNCAIVIVQVLGDTIRVVFSKEYSQYTTNDIVSELNLLMQKYNIWNVFVDASSPEIIRQAKEELRCGDSIDYEHELNRYRSLPTYNYILKNKGKAEAELGVRSRMVIVPVNFGTSHRYLTTHARELCSTSPPIIQISPKFEMLVNSLESATIDDSNKYIKSSSNYSDTFDAFRLCLCGVNYNTDYADETK